jgi:hypothetical protein
MKNAEMEKYLFGITERVKNSLGLYDMKYEEIVSLITPYIKEVGDELKYMDYKGEKIYLLEYLIFKDYKNNGNKFKGKM